MNIREQLCAAFCETLSVREVPSGVAVGTAFERPDGDRVGFYLVRGTSGMWRIEDDGSTIPSLLSAGINIQAGQRALEFQRMLQDAGAELDEEDLELRTAWIDESAIPEAALRFTTLLIRVFDFWLVNPEKVANTFKDDALALIRHTFSDAEVEFNEPISPVFADFVADAVVRYDGNPPLAIYIATSDSRVYEAVLLRTIIRFQYKLEYKVAAIIESEKPKFISLKVQQRARNHLDASPSFTGDAVGAMARLAEIVNYPPNFERLPGSLH